MELLVTIIILALIFDYINGFHDAANSIATIVSTRVLTPFQAVIWAAFFNFVAFFIAKYIIGGFEYRQYSIQDCGRDNISPCPLY
ncbi:MAG: inorganic phosphate transporter [Bacteroides stercoris]